MKNPQEFCDKLIAYVKRSAAPELRETRCAGEQEKWFMVWASGLTSELAEFMAVYSLEDRNNEAGDILWTIGALCIMLDINPMDVLESTNTQPSKNNLNALLEVIQLQGHAEKVVREGVQRRDICTFRTTLTMRGVYHYISRRINTEDALDAVIIKLDQRYPNGFDPDRSARRVA